MTTVTKSIEQLAPISKDRLAKLKARRDDEIDYSDIGELGVNFWVGATVNAQKESKVPVALRLDPEVLAWFKAQGEGHTTRMASILKHFYEHHHRP